MLVRCPNRERLRDPRRPWWAVARAVVAMGAGLVAACGRDSATLDDTLDLVRLFPFTEAGQVTDRIDLGTPDADRFLVEGWSEGGSELDGSSVSWAIARQARVRLGVLDPMEGRIELRCGLADGATLERVPIEVSLNHHRIGRLGVERGLRTVALALPVRYQRRGANEIELLNPLLSTRPRADARTRNRAVACDWINLVAAAGPVPHATAVTTADGAGELRIPAGAAVDFHVRVPPSGVLAFGLPLAEHEGALRIAMTSESGRTRQLYAGSGPAPVVRVDLRPDAGTLARVSFEATGEGVVRVVAPRLLGRRPPDPSPVLPVSAAAAPGRPNILLYVIDTLRADHLGCYGYPRATSPNLDALATEGMIFTNAVAQAPWTKPATASIHTGLYPIHHGAVTLTQRIRPEVPTLAGVLHAAGYRTAAFVTNANVSGEFGFKRGFDTYTYLPEDPSRPGVHVSADVVTTAVVDWVGAHAERPFFVYAHVTDPHAPYAPPPPFAERFHDPLLASSLPDVPNPVRVIEKVPALATPENVAALAALYDGEIAFTDDSFGRLMAGLREHGLDGSTVVVVTADHGEEFVDHGGFEHGYTLYGELVHIPLIARIPGARRGLSVAGLVRQIDLMPTLLAYAGVPAPAGLDGHDLRPTIEGAGEPSPEAFTQTRLGTADVAAIVTPEWKVIVHADQRSSAVEAYDRSADPTERTDIADRAPVVVGWARQRLAQWGTDATPSPNAKLHPELEERLRALGYLN